MKGVNGLHPFCMSENKGSTTMLGITYVSDICPHFLPISCDFRGYKRHVTVPAYVKSDDIRIMSRWEVMFFDYCPFCFCRSGCILGMVFPHRHAIFFRLFGCRHNRHMHQNRQNFRNVTWQNKKIRNEFERHIRHLCSVKACHFLRFILFNNRRLDSCLLL